MMKSINKSIGIINTELKRMVTSGTKTGRYKICKEFTEASTLLAKIYFL